jgi:hypothetical protein
MVGMVVGLGASIAIERFKVKPGCFQTSAAPTLTRRYALTSSARSSLLGVCLICLRGSTEVEDALVSLPGMLA